MTNKRELLNKDTLGSDLRDALHSIAGMEEIPLDESETLKEVAEKAREKAGLKHFNAKQVAKIEAYVTRDMDDRFDVMRTASMSPTQLKRLLPFSEQEEVEWIRPEPPEEQLPDPKVVILKDLIEGKNSITGMKDIEMDSDSLDVAQARIEEMTGATLSHQAIALIVERTEEKTLENIKAVSDLRGKELRKLREFAGATTDVKDLEMFRSLGEDIIDSKDLGGLNKAYLISLLEDTEDYVNICNPEAIVARLRAMFHEFIREGDAEGAPLFQDIAREVMDETRERCKIDEDVYPYF